MSTYLFTTPTVRETPAGYDRLFIRYAIDRGVTVIKRMDGSFYDARYPALTELEASADFWLGGHVYTLDQETRDELVAAGYGAYITQVVPYGAYGTLPYGQGPYGGGS